MRPIALGLTASATSSPDSASPTWQRIAEQVGKHFRATGPLTLPFWARTETAEGMQDSSITTDQLWHGLASGLVFTLDSKGRLADNSIVVWTASPELNAALVTAVRAADSALAFVFPPGPEKQPKGRIRLRLIDYTYRSGPAVGLALLSIPLIRVDQPIRLLNRPHTIYPAAALSIGLQGRVDAQFIVAESGLVAPESIMILRATVRDFAIEARKVFLKARFAPAMVDGCPVPMAMRQRVSFNIGR